VLGYLTLSSPIAELATLARRMLGEEDPDKEAELNEDVLDAVGEILNLMSAGVDQAFRDQVNNALRSRPMQWWRSDEPGDNVFEEGEFLLGRAEIAIPDAGTVQLAFRIPPALLDRGEGAEATHEAGSVVLVGLAADLCEKLQSILESARFTVASHENGAAELDELLPKADAIFLAEAEGSIEYCRNLRLSNDTWTVPLVLCSPEPTRELVVAAFENGVNHVLCLPADEMQARG
jgi:chemotaxis protein CheY-P-specific phosphatase CheC